MQPKFKIMKKLIVVSAALLLSAASYSQIQLIKKDSTIFKPAPVVMVDKRAKNPEEYKQWLKSKYPEWAQHFDSKTIALGMPGEVVYKILGRPASVNRSVGSWGVHEQLVYEQPYKTIYVYIENGKVTSWQE